jgi:hypothetical protein
MFLSQNWLSAWHLCNRLKYEAQYAICQQTPEPENCKQRKIKCLWNSSHIKQAVDLPVVLVKYMPPCAKMCHLVPKYVTLCQNVSPCAKITEQGKT